MQDENPDLHTTNSPTKPDNMALPTGNGDFVTPEDSKERSFLAPSADSFETFSRLLARLMPAPTVPRLTEKVLMSNHLQELNAVLRECSLSNELGFAPGAESRCRVAICDSFQNFPDIARQVSMWFSHGVGWSQIQVDLVKSYASPRDVAHAYSKALSVLQYSSTFPTACRDLFVIYHAVFVSHPHRMIDFVQTVCSKLPIAIRDRVIIKLTREAEDEYWQLTRPFWVPNDSHSVIGLIEENIRIDIGLKEFRPSVDKVKLVSEKVDKVNSVTESATQQPSTWLSDWVKQFASASSRLLKRSSSNVTTSERV